MIKKILKWSGVTVICFFAVTVFIVIANPDTTPPPMVVEQVEAQAVVQATPSTTPLVSEGKTLDVIKAATATIVTTPSKPVAVKEVAPIKSSPAPASAQYKYYAVTKVVDGDTVTIDLDGTPETIRLIGINTPETVDPRKPVECFGKQASDQAKTLLAGKQVRIEKDPTQGDRDKYGRLLAYIWRDDGLFFNQHMIQEGYAYEYTYGKPYKYQTQFKSDQATAQSSGKGLWATGVCDSTAVTATPPPTPLATSPSGHTFYLSTYYTSKLYYCDTDDGWKGLSTKYLKSYTSEQELLAAYPSRTLHEACK